MNRAVFSNIIQSNSLSIKIVLVDVQLCIRPTALFRASRNFLLLSSGQRKLRSCTEACRPVKQPVVPRDSLL